MGFWIRWYLLATLVTKVRCLTPNQPTRVSHEIIKTRVHQGTKTEYRDVAYALDEEEVELMLSVEDPNDWGSLEEGDGEEMNYTWEEDETALEADEEEEEIQELYDTGMEVSDEIEYEGEDDDAVYPPFEQLKDWTMEYIGLIDLAGGGMTRVSVGMQHTMHEAFVFTSPKIGPIGKGDFVKLMGYYNDNGLDLASAVPDLSVSYEGWHQDPDDPWRIWTIARYSGTHLGTARIPNTGLKLCPPNNNEHPVRFTTGPQVESFLWTPEGKLLWQTMGYVGDEYTGSNKGFGGLDGLMVSMGLPHLYLEATVPLRNAINWFSQFRGAQIPKTVSPYSRLPQWWHERKDYDWNVQK